MKPLGEVKQSPPGGPARGVLVVQYGPQDAAQPKAPRVPQAVVNEPAVARIWSPAPAHPR